MLCGWFAAAPAYHSYEYVSVRAPAEVMLMAATSSKDTVELPWPLQAPPPFKPGTPVGLSVQPSWRNIQATGSDCPACHTLPSRMSFSARRRNRYHVPVCQVNAKLLPQSLPLRNRTWFVPLNTSP